MKRSYVYPERSFCAARRGSRTGSVSGNHSIGLWCSWNWTKRGVTCGPKKRLPTKSPEPLVVHPLASEIGKVIQYYKEGWRFGTLKAIEKTKAIIIHPTTGICKIPLEDVNKYEHISS